MSELLSCPFCGAQPLRGLTKAVPGQSGEPLQRYRIWCPHGCCNVDCVDKEAAFERWNVRTPVMMAQLGPFSAQRKRPTAWGEILDLYKGGYLNASEAITAIEDAFASSDGRTDEAKAREPLTTVGGLAGQGQHLPNDHLGQQQAGVGSERSSPSEAAPPAPHAALREALDEWRAARQDVFDNTSKISTENDGRWKRLSDAEDALMKVARAALQPEAPAPGVMEALKDANDYHDHHPIDGPRRSGQMRASENATLFKREPREGSYFLVTAPGFPGWSYMLSPIENESRMKLSFVAFLEAEAVAAHQHFSGVGPTIAASSSPSPGDSVVTPQDHSVPVLIEALYRCGCPIAGNMTVGECAETEQCGCSIRAARLKGCMDGNHIISTERRVDE